MKPYHPRAGSLAHRVCTILQREPGRTLTYAEISAMERGKNTTVALYRAVEIGLLVHHRKTAGSAPSSYGAGPRLAGHDLDAKREGSVWTRERIERLRQRYPFTTDTRALAREIGVSKSALCSRASQLGLRKTQKARVNILKKRDFNDRPYVTTSKRTERILQLMREGQADGETSARIGQLVGIRPTEVGNALRQAIRKGIVKLRPLNRRKYTYHLNRGHRAGADDGTMQQIIVPAGAASAPVATRAPNSVFDLGRIAALQEHDHA